MNVVTKKEDIVAYWEIRKYEGDLGVDWCDAAERCWRCGCESRLQKCHIVPNSLNGSDQPSNLILLCARCHKEAPNSKNENFMWDWIKATKAPFYDMFWSLRGVEEYKKMYGKEPFQDLKPTNFKKIKPAIKKALEDSSFHYGEGGFNPSTLAGVIKMIEENLDSLLCAS